MRLTTLILPAELLLLGFLGSLVVAATRPARQPILVPVQGSRARAHRRPEG